MSPTPWKCIIFTDTAGAVVEIIDRNGSVVCKMPRTPGAAMDALMIVRAVNLIARCDEDDTRRREESHERDAC